jgi:hypothetical protein
MFALRRTIIDRVLVAKIFSAASQKAEAIKIINMKPFWRSGSHKADTPPAANIQGFVVTAQVVKRDCWYVHMICDGYPFAYPDLERLACLPHQHLHPQRYPLVS